MGKFDRVTPSNSFEGETQRSEIASLFIPNKVWGWHPPDVFNGHEPQVTLTSFAFIRHSSSVIRHSFHLTSSRRSGCHRLPDTIPLLGSGT